MPYKLVLYNSITNLLLIFFTRHIVKQVQIIFLSWSRKNNYAFIIQNNMTVRFKVHPCRYNIPVLLRNCVPTPFRKTGLQSNIIMKYYAFANVTNSISYKWSCYEVSNTNIARADVIRSIYNKNPKRPKGLRPGPKALYVLRSR